MPALHHAERSDADGELAGLLEAVACNDDVAWAAVVSRFGGRLRRITARFGLCPDDAGDAIQMTWIRLFEHAGDIRDPELLGGWLATTCRRECLRVLQRGVREVVSDDPLLGDVASVEDAGDALLARQRLAALRAAVSDLPERQRRLVVLLMAEPALAYEEIAEALDMPAGSIGPVRARCLARLARDPRLARLADTDPTLDRKARS